MGGPKPAEGGTNVGCAGAGDAGLCDACGAGQALAGADGAAFGAGHAPAGACCCCCGAGQAPCAKAGGLAGALTASMARQAMVVRALRLMVESFPGPRGIRQRGVSRLITTCRMRREGGILR